MPKKGYLTASTFKDLMSKGKTKDGIGLSAYTVADNLALGLMGLEDDEENEYTPRACMWGIEHEAIAIERYQDDTLCEVSHPVPFRVSPSLPYVGGSMDGLVGTHGGVEIKCPYEPRNHLLNLQDGRQLQQLYRYQVQGYLWIYELDWIDFVSYDPRFPIEKQIYIQRVTPDVEIIKALKERCEWAYTTATEKIRSIS